MYDKFYTINYLRFDIDYDIVRDIHHTSIYFQLMDSSLTANILILSVHTKIIESNM